MIYSSKQILPDIKVYLQNSAATLRVLVLLKDLRVAIYLVGELFVDLSLIPHCIAQSNVIICKSLFEFFYRNWGTQHRTLKCQEASVSSYTEQLLVFVSSNILFCATKRREGAACRWLDNRNKLACFQNPTGEACEMKARDSK